MVLNKKTKPSLILFSVRLRNEELRVEDEVELVRSSLRMRSSFKSLCHSAVLP